ncbi:MAG: hypothetical protein MPN21_17440 [Thermoanaerobaculia bacterium]|nr:hypothetical protein [Thermoanaerobaculia bacterium]
MSRRWNPWLFAACGLGLVPLWTATYPPMVDLAQHAAQVATWQRWNDPGFDYTNHFWVNLKTPYLVTNALAFALSEVVPVGVAFKLLISLAFVALLLATRALIHESGGNPLWALLVVPAGYSFAFYMGFVAFLFAVPWALLFVLLSWRYAHEPRLRPAVVLLISSQVLFLTHTIAFGWAGITGAAMVAAKAPDVRSALRRWWPFLLALVIPASWLLSTWKSEHLRLAKDGGTILDPKRGLELLSFTVGLPVHDLGLILGAIILALPFVTGGRASRNPVRWIPCGATVLFFLLTPRFLFGTAYLYQRFAAFLMPSLLFALDLRQTTSQRARTWLLALPAAAWLTFVQVQCFAFRVETGAFGSLLDSMESNRLVLYLPLDFRSQEVPYPAYLHFGSWYQVEKGGIVDYSFAQLFPNRYRYHPEAEPKLSSNDGWQPNRFSWQEHDGERYDYFLVRSGRDPEPFFRQARAPVTPVATATGGWWLYEQRRDATYVENPR